MPLRPPSEKPGAGLLAPIRGVLHISINLKKQQYKNDLDDYVSMYIGPCPEEVSSAHVSFREPNYRLLNTHSSIQKSSNNHPLIYD